MKIIIIKILLLLFNSFNSKILFVFEHFRHGARNPCNHIDKNGKDFLGKKWDFVGELNNVGKKQHFLLGIRNREKYKNFLMDFYHPKEILAFSTNRNRTIESLIANLMGMFYKKGKKMKENQKKNSFPQKINFSNNFNDDFNDFNLETFAIHLFKEEEHDFLLHEPKFCYPIKIIKYQLQNSMKKHAILFKNEFGSKLNEFLIKNGNEENSNKKDFFDSFINVYDFCDHFISDFIYDDEDLQIKKLTNYEINLNNLFNHCQKIAKIMQFDVVFGNDDVLFMSMSPSFKKIINWMEKRIFLHKLNKTNELDYNSPKFVIFSGHDTTIAGFIKIMNKLFGSEIINPEFSANVFFELDFKDEKYFVNYLFGDEILNRIEFYEFKKKIESFLWNDKKIYKFCDFDYFNIYKILLFFLIIIIFVLAGILFYFIKKNKKLNNNNLKEIKPIKLKEEENIKKE